MMSLPAFGSLCLHLSLLALALSAPLFFRARSSGGLGLSSARSLFGAAAALLSAGLLTLSVAALVHDFRIEYVASYSDRTTSIPYLLSSVWAGQAGSLMVWAVLLGWMSILLSRRLQRSAPSLESPAMGFLSLLLGFFLFVLVGWSNPFAVVEGTPQVDGAGLNPLLRNLLMIFHPPALLAGYAAYGPPAAITAAALLTGEIDKTFLRELRHWALIAWVFLTIGNVLGMVWAYEELGWGGYWGWDPVENASLIPWLTGTVLLHLLIVERKTRTLGGYGIVLALVTFWLTLLGTYLTRSGVVASVHAFSRTVVADAFGVLLIVVAIVSILALVIRRKALSPPTWAGAALVMRAAIGALALALALRLEGLLGQVVGPVLLAAVVSWRAIQPSLRGSFSSWFASYLVAAAAVGIVEPALWLSCGSLAVVLFFVGHLFLKDEEPQATELFARAKLLTATAWLVTLVAVGVLFGTLLPVLSRITIGESLQVDAEWYAGWAAPAGLLLLALTGTCLSLGWRLPGRRELSGQWGPAVVVALVAATTAWWLGVTAPLAIAAVGLAAMTGAAALLRAIRLSSTALSKVRAIKTSEGTSRERISSLTSLLTILKPYARSLGAALAHLGLAVFLFGVSGEAAKSEETFQLTRDNDARFGPYRLRLESVDHRFELDREVLGAVVTAEGRGQEIILRPERHRYRSHSNQPTSEAAVHTTGHGDLFVTLGEVDLESQQVWVRAVFTPLLPWIWFGCTLMALGGLLASIVAIRLRLVVAAVMSVSFLGVALVCLLWKPSVALVVAAGLCVALALWKLGLALLRPLWQPLPEESRCPSCDARLSQNSKFCHRCGAEVDDD